MSHEVESLYVTAGRKGTESLFGSISMSQSSYRFNLGVNPEAVIKNAVLFMFGTTPRSRTTRYGAAQKRWREMAHR